MKYLLKIIVFIMLCLLTNETHSQKKMTNFDPAEHGFKFNNDFRLGGEIPAVLKQIGVVFVAV